MKENLLIPPHSEDLEVQVIGAIILSPDCFYEVDELIDDTMIFANERNRIIYETIQELNRELKPIEFFTILEKLKNNKLFENNVIEDLKRFMNIPSSAFVLNHVRILKEYHINRLFIASQTKALTKAYEGGDAFELIEETGNFIDSINSRLHENSQTIETLTHDVYDAMERLRHGTVKPILTRLNDLDGATGGFYGGEFIIIAGRASMGKSALAQTIVKNLSIDRDVPGALFSLEMTDYQTVIRFLAMETDLSVKDYRSGKYQEKDVPQISKFFDKFSKSKLYLDTSAHLTASQLRSKAIILKKKYGIQYLVIDYLQLMSGSKKAQNRDLEMGEVSRMCKAISKELNIPVIGLCQISRKAEENKEKKPMLAHLRESGNFEQDADTIILLYRPEYYQIRDININGKTQDSTGIVEVIIAKGRNSGTGSIYLRFIAEKTMFTSLENQYEINDSNIINRF